MGEPTDVKLTRNALIEEIARILELPRSEGHLILDVILSSIVRAVLDGNKVEVRGFGSFHTRQRPPRNGRNPRTGGAVKVSATTVAYFKPSKELLALVNRPTIVDIPGTKSEHP